MDNIERYLRLATWGLWGEHKRTVRLELSSHIHHKANQYEALGYTPSAAISRALSDLGPPHVVSAGMNGVYTMPNILRNTLLCAVLATLGIGNLTSSVAQVVGTTRVPIADCANGQTSFVSGKQPWPCEQPRIWISLSSLRVTLESKGVKVSEVGTTMRLRFPNSNEDVLLYREPAEMFRRADGTFQSFEANPNYVTTSQLFSAFYRAKLRVQINGWDNAQILVGETAFTLGTREYPILGNNFYRDAINPLQLEKMFPSITPERKPDNLEDLLILTSFQNPLTIRSGDNVGYSYSIRVRDTKSDEVFLILSREGPTDFVVQTDGVPKILQNARRAYLVPVSADGTVRYNSPSKKLSVSSPDKLPRCVIDGAGTISVLRFSGRIDSSATDTLTRVAPEDVTVQAVK